MKSGTESLATFYGSLNLLLSAYSQEVLDLKAAWVNCQLVVVDRCYFSVVLLSPTQTSFNTSI
jgi:hypothetical protein